MSVFRLTTTKAPAAYAARSAAFRAAARPIGLRSFQTGRVLGASKETAEGSEARKEEIEREKQHQLQQQKEGKNEWKQSLASESESITKADRGDLHASDKNISELQKESVKAHNQERK